MKFLLALIGNPFSSELHVLTTKLKFRPDNEDWNINSHKIDTFYNNDDIVELMSLYMCSHLQYSYVNMSIFSYLWTYPSRL